VSGVGARSSGEAVLDGAVCQGWWVVVDEDGPGRILAGPFLNRAEADWAAAAYKDRGTERVRSVYGIRRADGVLGRPSPQDRKWLGQLREQLDRLPEGWDAGLSDDDPLGTLVVEVVATLAEAGLPLHDSRGAGSEVGGVCLAPEPGLDGIVVSWRQHDRMCLDQVHGVAADGLVQQMMNRALADVLALRGFAVHGFGDSSGHVVRAVA
jgi:hypothetical protein